MINENSFSKKFQAIDYRSDGFGRLLLGHPNDGLSYAD